MKIEKGIDFTDKGYKCWKSENEYNKYTNHWQKRVESDKVCECNDKLHVNITESLFSFNNGKDIHNSFTIDIVAEIKGLWWTLNSYSLRKDDLHRVEEIESILIKLINTI